MLKGKQSIEFDDAPYLISSGNVVGKKEGEGPLGQLFDFVQEDDLFGQETTATITLLFMKMTL